VHRPTDDEIKKSLSGCMRLRLSVLVASVIGIGGETGVHSQSGAPAAILILHVHAAASESEDPHRL
jgi:hypothetical protein